MLCVEDMVHKHGATACIMVCNNFVVKWTRPLYCVRCLCVCVHVEVKMTGGETLPCYKNSCESAKELSLDTGQNRYNPKLLLTHLHSVGEDWKW